MQEKNEIRYTELHFTLRIISDAILPRYKSSAIRGGMGDMLIEECCIRDKLREAYSGKCDVCDFYDGCLVQQIMYPMMKIVPEFMSLRESVGYIVECEDYREKFKKDDELIFSLILFGNNICFLNQYLSAIYRFGNIGIGKSIGKFEVISIKNEVENDIFKNGCIYKENYNIKTLSEYVDRRKKQIYEKFGYEIPNRLRIDTVTGLSLKKEGKVLEVLDMESFIEAAVRRIYIMRCFEGIDSIYRTNNSNLYAGINVERCESKKIGVARYSVHKNQKIILNGVLGSILLDISKCENKDKLIETLIMGEKLHIGSNITFGNGKYRLVFPR